MALVLKVPELVNHMLFICMNKVFTYVVNKLK